MRKAEERLSALEIKKEGANHWQATRWGKEKNKKGQIMGESASGFLTLEEAIKYCLMDTLEAKDIKVRKE